MVYCRVFGCTNTGKRARHLRFYRIPRVIRNQGDGARELSEERRRLWLTKLNQNLKGKNIDNIRICSAHFISGEKAGLYCRNSPDWVPSVHMSPIVKEKTKRYHLKTSSRSWCCAQGCPNSHRKQKGVSFLGFPKDEERCWTWIKNSHKDKSIVPASVYDKLSQEEKTKVNSSQDLLLCEDHFDVNQFEHPEDKGTDKVCKSFIRDAVPTIFRDPFPVRPLMYPKINADLLAGEVSKFGLEGVHDEHNYSVLNSNFKPTQKQSPVVLLAKWLNGAEARSVLKSESKPSLQLEKKSVFQSLLLKSEHEVQLEPNHEPQSEPDRERRLEPDSELIVQSSSPIAVNSEPQINVNQCEVTEEQEHREITEENTGVQEELHCQSTSKDIEIGAQCASDSEIVLVPTALSENSEPILEPINKPLSEPTHSLEISDQLLETTSPVVFMTEPNIEPMQVEHYSNHFFDPVIEVEIKDDSNASCNEPVSIIPSTHTQQTLNLFTSINHDHKDVRIKELENENEKLRKLLKTERLQNRTLRRKLKIINASTLDYIVR